jgi:hypothetical protein
MLNDCRKCADPELPCPEERQVEDCIWMRLVQRLGYQHAAQDPNHHKKDYRPDTKKHGQQQRPHQVELFLYTQRPQVQERLQVRRRVKVAGAPPERHICDR